MSRSTELAIQGVLKAMRLKMAIMSRAALRALLSPQWQIDECTLLAVPREPLPRFQQRRRTLFWTKERIEPACRGAYELPQRPLQSQSQIDSGDCFGRLPPLGR